jgi:biotin synthase
LADILAVARQQVLERGDGLSQDQVLQVLQLPDDRLEELLALAHEVRMRWCGPEVEVEGIISLKTGGCPEDCHFCSQSGLFASPVRSAWLDVPSLVEAAKQTAKSGATEFCIVAAVRGPDERLLSQVAAGIEAIRDEVEINIACSLGMLSPEQVQRLSEMGVHRYNHNLETARSFFTNVVTTHTWEERWQTLSMVRDAGMEVCCGGILGMGETLEQRVDFAFELAELDPCEVPINLLDPRPGTPLADHKTLSPREALQAIALFRLILPGAWLRLAGGRERVLGELQGMGLVAGANALIVGNYLTTIGRSPEEDHALLDALGMPVADGPGEGRFIVDADGAHSMPARRSIPLSVE